MSVILQAPNIYGMDLQSVVVEMHLAMQCTIRPAHDASGSRRAAVRC
jgi:hypothetical protein